MFNRETGYETSPYYIAQMRNGPVGHTDEDSWSVAMRLLIHYVGDSHQPLHGETRVDKAYEQGDKGGNDFPLPNHYSVNELHALWDSTIYELHVNPKLPFSDADWTAWGLTADKFVEKHPVSTLKDVTNLDPKEWAKETFEIASNYAYIGIKENEVIPQSYIDTCMPLAEAQLVTAGNRLANILMSLTHLSIPVQSPKFLQH